MTSSKSYQNSSFSHDNLFLSKQVIINPVTGDRMTILCSTADSNGEYFRVQFDLPPGAKGSPLHYHGSMHETFEVVRGSLNMELCEKGNRKTLRTGDKVYVYPGMYHSFWNESHDWVTFISEMRPAGNFEQFIKAWYGLAGEGKVNKDGVPTNLLQLALIVQKSDTIFVGQPPFLQKLVLNILAKIARIFKLDRTIVKYWR